MRRYIWLYITFISITWTSCREDFETVPSAGSLGFSRDTVYLDTVFTNVGSSTYRLKVYNRSDKDIHVPSVELERGESSFYRLNVDGVAGKSFEDVEILAKDSIFVFVETTIDISSLTSDDLTFLYTDKIVFDTGPNRQEVPLVTLVQDAVFLYPERFEDGTTETLQIGVDEDGEPVEIYGFYLDDETLHFTDEKPYVIYGYAAVPPGKTMTVDPGSRLHFHDQSGILVTEGGTIKSIGTPSTDPDLMKNEIVFQGDRLEPTYSDRPGQWGFIWLTQGSTAHEFVHTTIKNGTVGIIMDSNDGGATPTLTLRNTQIYNSALAGLMARTGHVYGENLVINNSGLSSLICDLGGRYTFKHSTFANYWSQSSRRAPAVSLSNKLEAEGEVFVADLEEAVFSNCIIYGNRNTEIGLNAEGSALFNFHFNNSLIRFFDQDGQFEDDPLYDFDNTQYYLENVFNEGPDFMDSGQNQMIIGEASGAVNIGDQQTADEVPLDIIGVDRTANPDAGAYQHIVFEEDE